jgi:hypothetical protein
MAIYQFKFTVIPKSGVFEKHGHVPEQLHIDHKAWEKYYEELNLDALEDSFDFEDALTHDWWKNSEVEADSIIQLMNSIAQKAPWSNSDNSISWKNEGDDIADEDASLGFDKQTNRIKEFSFRFDLSFGVNGFLKTLVDFCEQHDLLLMDTNGKLIEPKIDLIGQLVSNSNAHRFLANPTQFFDDLSSGRLTIE